MPTVMMMTRMTAITKAPNRHWIVPDWPAPHNVRSLSTTRHGGVSEGGYTCLNLGDHVGDEAEAVSANRARLRASVPAEPLWLRQVHGLSVVDAATCAEAGEAPFADASFSRVADVVCTVMTADCLPVLLCDRAGTVVAAVHAGWRGLQAGVIEQAVAAMQRPAHELLVWLGPAIGPTAFEVGDDVRDAFLGVSAQAAAAFVSLPNGKWLADIYLLARQRLSSLGVDAVSGGDFCTFGEADRFFSFRRDGATGRMASLVWLAD